MKKPAIFFTRAIGDVKYTDWANRVRNSFMKFHKDIPFKIYTGEDYVRMSNSSQMNEMTSEFLPLILKELIKEYELVVPLDSDQIILGDLNYIIDQRHNYDLGTVYNLNRVDLLTYTPCSVCAITPEEYYNLGLAAFTSEEVVDHFCMLCDKYRSRFEYREQDILNILAYYGNYRVKCFDDYDEQNNYSAWHGLKAKGEGLKFILKDNKVILPQEDRDIIIKLYHWAGGQKERKHTYNLDFKDDITNYIKTLIT